MRLEQTRKKATRNFQVVLRIVRFARRSMCSATLLLTLVTFAVGISPSRASGRDMISPSVLVLQSYHPQLSWVKSIDRGIRTYFEKENPNVELRFEYMDTKRITDPSYIQILLTFYKYKFRDAKFDVIICSDNNGLNFLLKYHDVLFHGTPVVFCGINNFSDDMLVGEKLFTGTVEVLSIKEILDLATQLHPGVEQIFFFGDDSTTYYATKKSVERVAATYKPDIQFHFVNNLTINHIRERIRHLGKGSLVLQGSTVRDENGKLLSFEKSVSMMEEVSKVPVYGFWDFYLGHGIIGGKLTSGLFQGKTAAQMANRILNGEAVAEIPVVRESPNQYMFDANQLEKFHIDPSRLPVGSIIINNQPSYFTRNRKLIVSAVSVVSVLIIIIFLLVLNIRSRKCAEKELSVSERKYRNLLESISTVPWEMDVKSCKYTYMGRQIEQILGYSVDSWKDVHSWVARIHSEDKKEAVEFCEIETRKGLDHDFIYRAIHLDGSYRWIRNIISVVTGDDGPEKLIGFMYDITKQKDLSLEKEKLEARLVQAQKMEAIGTLAGGIAHDFNNILAAILGYTEMAREDVTAGSRIEDDLDKVLIAAHRAKDLVKQILSFSRHAEIERIPLKIQPLIQEGLKMLRSSIPTTISIIENIDSQNGTILANPTEVHQILINLCTNAYHAMQDDGGVLSVTLKTIIIKAGQQKMDLHLNPGEYVELTISDTGVGIGPDIIERIFDPYFTTKEIGKGTGMGLAISHGIMKNHGGMIAVESTLGKGSNFHVYFPVIKRAVLPLKQEKEEVPRGTERILLVDDEELLAAMGRAMLERLGYHVTVERNSLEALYLFQNNPDEFDLVITDQTMPDMTGVELARRMMQIRTDIPIILCTGYSNLIDGDSAKSLGIREFALKPLTKRGIAGLIRKALA